MARWGTGGCWPAAAWAALVVSWLFAPSAAAAQPTAREQVVVMAANANTKLSRAELVRAGALVRKELERRHPQVAWLANVRPLWNRFDDGKLTAGGERCARQPNLIEIVAARPRPSRLLLAFVACDAGTCTLKVVRAGPAASWPRGLPESWQAQAPGGANGFDQFARSVKRLAPADLPRRELIQMSNDALFGSDQLLDVLAAPGSAKLQARWLEQPSARFGWGTALGTFSHCAAREGKARARPWQGQADLEVDAAGRVQRVAVPGTGVVVDCIRQGLKRLKFACGPRNVALRFEVEGDAFGAPVPRRGRLTLPATEAIEVIEGDVEFDRAALGKKLHVQGYTLARCFSTERSHARLHEVSFRLGADGTVRNVKVHPMDAGTDANCLERALRKVRLRGVTGGPGTVRLEIQWTVEPMD